MVLQNYQNLIDMTSNIFHVIAFGVGFKCPRKIHLNTKCPPHDIWIFRRLCIYFVFYNTMYRPLIIQSFITFTFFFLYTQRRKKRQKKYFSNFFNNNCFNVLRRGIVSCFPCHTGYLIAKRAK